MRFSTSLLKRVRLSLGARISLIAVASVVATMAAILALVLTDISAEMHRRANDTLDTNMRVLRHVASSVGQNGQFSVSDGIMRVGQHVISPDDAIIDQTQEIVGGTATIFLGDTRIATNVKKPDGSRAVGTKLQPGPVYDAVLRDGKAYNGEATILGASYFTYYEPLRGADGGVLGILYVGVKKSEFLAILDQLTVRAVLAGLAIAVTGSLVLWLALRQALSPLGSLASVMRSLSAGEYAVLVPAQARGDVIGSMARTVEEFRRGLLEAEQLRADAAGLAERNVQERRSAIMDLADRLEAEVGQAAEALSHSASDMRSNARIVSEVVGRTREQATSVAATSDQAAEDVNVVAAAAEEMSASLNGVADHAGESVRIAKRAAEESRSTDTLMRSLAEAADRINSVVGVIQNVAGQTNLLALNATIEAARAGEAGRGFAVVAAEVKQLANQTDRATGDIREQVGAIQKAMSEALAAIATIGGTVSELNTIGASVADTVEQQRQATAEIAQTVEQVAQGARSMAKTVAEVRQGTGRATEAASAAVTVADDIAKRSELLTGAVKAFLTEVRAAS